MNITKLTNISYLLMPDKISLKLRLKLRNYVVANMIALINKYSSERNIVLNFPNYLKGIKQLFEEGA